MIYLTKLEVTSLRRHLRRRIILSPTPIPQLRKVLKKVTITAYPTLTKSEKIAVIISLNYRFAGKPKKTWVKSVLKKLSKKKEERYQHSPNDVQFNRSKNQLKG